MANAGELKKGACFIYQGNPVKIVKKEVVAVGTHSHTKLKLFVKNMFSGAESIATMSHQDKVETVEIKKKEAQLVSINNEKLMIMDLVSYETMEAEADGDVINSLNEGDKIIFVEFKGKVRVLEKSR